MALAWKIFIPYIGPSTNAMYAGQHWTRRKKHKELAHRAVICALYQEKKLYSFKNPVIIDILPILDKKHRAYDVSNYSYTYKLIEDSLVSQNIVKDDTAKYIKRVTFHAAVKGDQSGMMITITEAI